MARKVKDCPRNDYHQENIVSGELFMDFNGKLFDSNTVNVVHHGLDTVRQLYSGLINRAKLMEVEHAYNKGFGCSLLIGEFEFVVSSGGRSGYRFILKNDNLGLVIMLGSQYCEPKYNGHHLKIQCSPIFLLERTFDQVQSDMDLFSKILMTQILHTGVAVHLCADVQGWSIPDDLDAKITTRAHKVYKASGASAVNYEFNDVSIKYGLGETFTFGKASTLQFSVYLKSKAVKDKHEQDLWHPVWADNADFKLDLEVIRLECRFHQNVVNQFANGSGFTANKLTDLDGHLTGLWKYALNNFRLDDSSTYINPFWQYMRDDVAFDHKQVLGVDYVRMYKSPLELSEPTDRAVSICFGQLCSIYAKNGYTVKQAFKYLFNSGFWVNLHLLFRNKGWANFEVERQVIEAIEKKYMRFNLVV